MCPVWRPVDMPPVLDKFCHLSLDAQRVMAALYSDYHQKIAETAAAQAQIRAGPADPVTYYQSIYEARFGTSAPESSTSTYGLNDIQSNQTSVSNVEVASHIRLYHSTEVDKRQQINHGLVYSPLQSTSGRENCQNFHSDIEVTRNRGISSNGYDTVNQKKSQNAVKRNIFGTFSAHPQEGACGVQTVPDHSVILSQDTSNYSDSPPIETQDYRILSQFHNEDSQDTLYNIVDECETETDLSIHLVDTVTSHGDTSHTADDGISVSAKTFQDIQAQKLACNKTRRDLNTEMQVKQSAVTLLRNKQNLNSVSDIETERMSYFENHDWQYHKASEAVDNSQCLFSQDVPIKTKRAPRKRQNMVDKMPARDHQTSLDNQDAGHYSNGNNQTTGRPENQPMDIYQNTNNSAKHSSKTADNINAIDVPLFNIDFAVGESNNDFHFNHTMLTESPFPNTEMKPKHEELTADIRHTTAEDMLRNIEVYTHRHNTRQSDQMGGHKVPNIAPSSANEMLNQTEKNGDDRNEGGDECDVEDSVRNNKKFKQHSHPSIVTTKIHESESSRRHIRKDGTSTESEYFHRYTDKTSSTDRESPFGKQPVFPIFRQPGHREADDRTRLGGAGISCKRKQKQRSSFTVPSKKQKPTESVNSSSSSTNYQESVVSIANLSWESTQHLAGMVLNSNRVVLSLVYQGNSTQLRNNLFEQENKKKCTGKTSKCTSVEGFAVYPLKSSHNKVLLFPLELGSKELNNWAREFWKALLADRHVKKLGFQVKELLIEVFKCYKFDENKVNPAWLVYDASIAWWLLDPDKTVSSFQQLLLCLAMPEQAPSQCSVTSLQSDMALLGAAMDKLQTKLECWDLWHLFCDVETRLVPVLAAMELRPITVATHTLLHFSEVLKKKLLQLQQLAHKEAGHPFLLTSHAQLRQVLFEELRLDRKLVGKTKLAKTSVGRETSTSESVLTQLLPFHPLPAIVLEHRQLQKLKSTYFDGMLSCVNDGELCTHWDQTAAVTGRLTSYQPNIQAIPKVPVTISGFQTSYIPDKETCEQINVYARDPFVSRPGYSLVAADFQQIELRLLGHLAADPCLIRLFNEPDVPDIFIALTSQWLGKPIEQVTSTDREQTKRVVYSVMYGVGKEKLAEYLKITTDNAKAIMASFLVKFPAVSQFTRSCIEFCQRNGYTESIFKRRRLFPNMKTSNHMLQAQAERQCVNFCVQGSAADLCKAAMLQVEKNLTQHAHLDARLLVQIHDELLLEVADTHLTTVVDVVKSVMESKEKLCGSQLKLKVPIPISISIGKKWGHMEPYTAVPVK